ncbi:SPOR domain-containing protein [Marinobacter salinisoli]|uniref:SPOR domain-containing protein n=1 Tax=Marinobacter salinisoli TaxID=2769486 RepID=A0ABX7N0Z8_9GAMM|nr:SPOR domain-containing protein [Marinobacter salinisoli]QSP96093.1 SPOR domain-containing protein [Marinobacter salinisoli]
MEERLSTVDSGGLVARLQQRFGLRANPMDFETPFFPDAMRHHALESLRHLCGFGDMAILLTGADGVGKTRLLAELVRSESARLEFKALPASAFTSAKSLAMRLKAIAPPAFREERNPRDSVYHFFRWSESRARKGQRMVLLIDDADRVPGELLRLLVSAFLASERSAAALPVLAGTDQLAGLVDPTIAASGMHQIHLRPLTQEEVHAYLEPRIYQAGGDVRKMLSPANVAVIHTLSQGSFGRIKRVAPGVWLGLAGSPSGTRRRPSLLGTLAWPALALALLAGSWWFVSRQYDQSMAESASQSERAAPARKSITVGPAAPVTDDAEAPSPKPVFMDELAAPERDLSGPGAPELAEAERSVRQSDADSEGDDAPDVAVERVEPELPETDVVPEDDEADASESLPAKEVSETLGPGVQSRTELPSTPEAQAPAPDNGMVGAPDFQPSNPDRFVDIAQLRSNGGWVVQLVAGNLEKTALSLLEQHRDLEGLVYTRSERQGRFWFMVFAGPYPTREAARAAETNLPKDLRDQSPWIRAASDL